MTKPRKPSARLLDTVSEYADRRGRSRAWVFRLIKEGMPLASGTGTNASPYRIDPDAATEWETGPRMDRLLKARAPYNERLALARLAKLELVNERERAELVPLEGCVEIARTLSEFIDRAVDAMVERIAAHIVSIPPDTVRARIRRETDAIKKISADHYRRLAAQLEVATAPPTH